MAANKNLAKAGEQAFTKMDKINAEVFTLTYGSMVQQLLKDYEDVSEVNTQLEKMYPPFNLPPLDALNLVLSSNHNVPP